jgi:omega-6 fatty acid desaturase (delta-12 desaturase)
MATIPESNSAVLAPRAPDWRGAVAPYQKTEVARSLIQLVTTLLLLAAGFAAMLLSLRWSYAITLLLAFPTAGLLVRTFIIMHDCAHGSFLPWRRVNDAIGFCTGVMTLTPFQQWRRDHALHHASSGDLDRRGHGDIDTITVREYLAKSPGDRLRYRIMRHPLAILGVGPIYLMFSQRFRSRSRATKDKQIASVWGTNAAIFAAAAIFFFLGVLPEVLMVYVPVFYLAGVAGVFLFYVQHQFEDTYWEQHADWDYESASLAGSSYLKLPRPLAWLTGDIGVHHVHHISPRIPNYKLRRCHDENAIFHDVTVITLRDARRSLKLALWDEDRRRLISFRELTAAGSSAGSDRKALEASDVGLGRRTSEVE